VVGYKTRWFSTKKAGVANSRGWEALARRVTGPGRWTVRRDIFEKMKEAMALKNNAKKSAVGDWSFATGFTGKAHSKLTAGRRLRLQRSLPLSHSS
jgi:hypothetical protein